MVQCNREKNAYNEALTRASIQKREREKEREKERERERLVANWFTTSA